MPHTSRLILWYDEGTSRVKIATHARFDEGFNDLPSDTLPPNCQQILCQNGTIVPQEFVIGGDDLLDGDQFLFTDYNLDRLLESDMDLKRSWLERTYAARRAIDLPEEEEELLDESNMVQLTFNDFGWID